MLILLRLIHVLAGIFWVGAFLFLTFYLFPTLLSAGPAAAGPVMGGLQRRGLMTALPIIAFLTIASGLALVWVMSGGDVGAYARGPVGRALTTAGGLAIVAFLIGVLVVRPAAMASARLTQELSGLAPGPARDAVQTQLGALQRRMTLANRLVAGLLLVTVAGMAVARYL